MWSQNKELVQILIKLKLFKTGPDQKHLSKWGAFLVFAPITGNMWKNFAIIARPLHKLCEKGSIFQWNDECEQAFIRLKDALTSPGRQHNNADALSRTPCKVCLRHQERNTEEKSEPEWATTLEQVRMTTGSKQSHSVEPNLMNSEILKKNGNQKK